MTGTFTIIHPSTCTYVYMYFIPILCTCSIMLEVLVLMYTRAYTCTCMYNMSYHLVLLFFRSLYKLFS